MLAKIDEAWVAGDAPGLQKHAQLLGDVASDAYRLAERASDALEVLVGVLMIEAWDLASGAPDLASVEPAEWDEQLAAQHLLHVRMYTQQVQDRLHEILSGE